MLGSQVTVESSCRREGVNDCDGERNCRSCQEHRREAGAVERIDDRAENWCGDEGSDIEESHDDGCSGSPIFAREGFGSHGDDSREQERVTEATEGSGDGEKPFAGHEGEKEHRDDVAGESEEDHSMASDSATPVA